MLNFARRLVVPGLTFAIVGGLWFLQLLKNECEQPLPNTMRVDPALVQKAMRAASAYSDATAHQLVNGSDGTVSSG